MNECTGDLSKEEEVNEPARKHSYQKVGLPAMTSLKRSLADPYASNIASKVFVRSTKSGKVQKIVRELYLRRDIPCSSKICSVCLANAPADANGVGRSSQMHRARLPVF